jgi:hypothetical protein
MNERTFAIWLGLFIDDADLLRGGVLLRKQSASD